MEFFSVLCPHAWVQMWRECLEISRVVISSELDFYQSTQWPLANLQEHRHHRAVSYDTDLSQQTKRSTDSWAWPPSRAAPPR